MPWINRIAAALEVEPADLLGAHHFEASDVTAVIAEDGGRSPQMPATLTTSISIRDAVAVLIEASVGEYRVHDEVWCQRLGEASDFERAVNLDVLAPLPSNRFMFGRLVKYEREKLHIVPFRTGAETRVIASPSWIAVVKTLVRKF